MYVSDINKQKVIRIAASNLPMKIIFLDLVILKIGNDKYKKETIYPISSELGLVSRRRITEIV